MNPANGKESGNTSPVVGTGAQGVSAQAPSMDHFHAFMRKWIPRSVADGDPVALVEHAEVTIIPPLVTTLKQYSVSIEFDTIKDAIEFINALFSAIYINPKMADWVTVHVQEPKRIYLGVWME